jgi:hypothetical protein
MESFSSAGGLDSRKSGGGCHPVDVARVFFCCLFDSRSVKYGIAAMIRIFPVKARKAWAFSIPSYAFVGFAEQSPSS